MMPLKVPLNTIVALIRSLEHSAEMCSTLVRFKGRLALKFVAKFVALPIIDAGCKLFCCDCELDKNPFVEPGRVVAEVVVVVVDIVEALVASC